MIVKSERVGKLVIFQEHDIKGNLINTVFFNYAPVARFNINDVNERKVAAIELVERGLCNQKHAGRICGFHRNTVFKLLRAKRLLGLEAVFVDNRGLSHLITILMKFDPVSRNCKDNILIGLIRPLLIKLPKISI
jgi:hypothetical protein